MSREKIGEILVKKGFITSEQLSDGLGQQQKNSHKIDKIGEILIELGYVKEENLLLSLSEQLSIPYLKEIPFEVPAGLLSKFSISFLRSFVFLPLRKEGEETLIVMADPLASFFDELETILGTRVKRALGRKKEILKLIEQGYYRGDDAVKVEEDLKKESESPQPDFGPEEPDNLLDLATRAPVIRAVNQIIFQAVERRASDIHIQSLEHSLKVRYRIDGLLYDSFTFPRRFQPAIVSRIKVISGLNIAEHRLPQDGRTTIKFDNRELDIRISTMPTFFGENVVLRLLDKSTFLFGLEDLGLSSENFGIFSHLIGSDHGIILLTGPTGSGKTTTLYASLDKISSPTKNVITLEDPVEYQLAGINQIQINPKIGLSFANGLRFILRHDPDIMMVGEIRDTETAEMAIQSSLTGHLVFSTLHTNDSASAITRLLDMGIEPYLISSSLLAVMAQRLVRRVCKNCPETYSPAEESLAEIGLRRIDLGEQPLLKGKGCRKCLETGYQGRTGIFELLVINDEIRRLIMEKKPAHLIKKNAIGSKMKTLRADGAKKVLENVTTIEEVLRVTQE
ncbi:MAG: type II secretion system protein GspE [bacterium (Candidatus Ratteibacteria) CG_4_10_14_3_um_filter_41_18]|uniref:Type II secretion system protein GspE n=4 Tax=Candidatus Ratteibacteria TaxID=2979319 RepID=A0A2M7E8H1_9BACT|nr:MAG: type II secretion system protein GspE [Candidatus Omnitrophica bacterium CG1_02_41_171]PIV64040.1 MAG: type II secretion system protein GspE [bacterium (Candidatus Ratteibacteria) CG01_land_8_20_14_3_00_40_19]PIW33854.1 MAG: type II secretion system protein GspE [bacterium (Candidatus Ratteibacteria) CG15_BIG_FIL_POST_REV_8_21_14_020_41_12]PIW74298.1 MAG: type II secretion system protein GspE [bacterium (Candidatus Ratteibacteria) CG_4_8_14_3_um_filter_41_36]PIX77918.1 MAG: type II secr